MPTTTDILRDRIRTELKTALVTLDLDPDSVYVNGVNNVDERLVTHSLSLTEEALDKRLHRDEYPNGVDYSGLTHIALFTKAYTFEDEHRITALTLENLSACVNACLKISE
ncbi:hypothetical protein SB766_14625 [Pseudomonas sp. SIMBA_077]